MEGGKKEILLRLDNGINLLLQAFDTADTFYILGSGASAGILPVNFELGDKIGETILDIGSFPVTGEVPPALIKRLLLLSERWESKPYKYLRETDGDELFTPDVWTDIQKACIGSSPPALYWALLHNLNPKPTNLPRYQYEVFRLAKKSSTFFNMNIDGLASKYCQGHLVLEPHGRNPLIIFPHLSTHIKEFMEHDVYDDTIFNGYALLPQPEPIHITNGIAYDKARIPFFKAQNIVLIGYAFGGGDDSETFEFLREMLKKNNKPVIVVDRDPAWIVSSIQEATNLKTVYPLKLKWNFLSQSICETFKNLRVKNARELILYSQKILYKYHELNERSKMNKYDERLIIG